MLFRSHRISDTDPLTARTELVQRVTMRRGDWSVRVESRAALTATAEAFHFAARLEAQAWHTVAVDGHDRQAIAQAIEESHAEADRPSLIICKTHIAHGAPNLQDTAASHGQPLGHEEVKMTKEGMGYPIEPEFWVDESVYDFFAAAMQRGRDAHSEWEDRLDHATEDQRDLWESLHAPEPVALEGLGLDIGERMATRASSGKLFEIGRAHV